MATGDLMTLVTFSSMLTLGGDCDGGGGGGGGGGCRVGSSFSSLSS